MRPRSPAPMRRSTGGVRRRALHDQVRGLHPWPHATLVCDGRRVIVHRSTVPAVRGAATARHRHRRRPPGRRRRLWRRAGAAPAGPAARRRPTAAGRGVPGRAWPSPRRSVRDTVIAPARRAAFDALVELAGGRRDLADVLDGARRPLVDPRDVALLQELVVGTMRWQSRLDAAIAQLSRVPWRSSTATCGSRSGWAPTSCSSWIACQPRRR